MITLNKKNLRSIGVAEARLLGITKFERGWKRKLRGRRIGDELWRRIQTNCQHRRNKPKTKSRRYSATPSKAKTDYAEYLRSPLWKSIRQRTLERDNYECCVCLGRATQVHHLSYDRETMSGRSIQRLVSICRGCHEEIEFDAEGEKRPLHLANWRLCEMTGVSLAEFEASLKSKEQAF